MDKDKIVEFLSSDSGKELFNDDKFKEVLSPFIEEAKKPLMNKRDELLSELQQLKELKVFKELGDYNTVKSQLAELNTLKSNTGTKDAEHNDEKLKALEASLKEELNKERSKFDNFKSNYIKSNINIEINNTLIKHKGSPELLSGVISNRLSASFDDESNTVKYDVLTKDGKPMYKNGEPATIEDLVNEMKVDPVYSRAFDGSGHNGSGTKAVGTNGVKNGQVITDMNDPNYSLSKHMEYLKKTRQ